LLLIKSLKNNLHHWRNPFFTVKGQMARLHAMNTPDVAKPKRRRNRRHVLKIVEERHGAGVRFRISGLYDTAGKRIRRTFQKAGLCAVARLTAALRARLVDMKKLPSALLRVALAPGRPDERTLQLLGLLLKK
jgi:hypothetical protein